jgi:hypothetical protein
MGLFNRRPQKDADKERFLSAKLTEVRYTSLQELVVGEVSLNSDDAKAVTITFPQDRTVKLWVADDKLIAATDSAGTVDFKEFLYWIDASESLKSTLITEVKELTPSSLPALKTKAPELYDDFVGYTADYTVEALKWASENLDSYTGVDTQIFKQEAVVEALAGNGIEITELDEYVAKRRAEEANTDRLIGITGVAHSDVKLSLKDSSYSSTTPEEMFILAAGDADSTLAEAIELGNGFSALSLLETVKNLYDAKVIGLAFATDLGLQLPDLTEIPLKPYERIFIPTELGTPILPVTERVFEQSAWRDAILVISQDNDKLEERIDGIEDKLIKELADEDFVEFAELPGDVQASVRLLLKEREAHNEKRVAILNKIRENLLVDEPELSGVIDAKLAGIDAAGVRFDLVDLTSAENDFDIDEHELEFKFNDGVISKDANGDPFIRELAEGEELAEVEEVDASFFDQVSELQAEDDDDEVELADHAFAFDEFYETLDWVQKAELGVKPIRVEDDTLPPIFLQVAAGLGIDPYAIGR